MAIATAQRYLQLLPTTHPLFTPLNNLFNEKKTSIPQSYFRDTVIQRAIEDTNAKGSIVISEKHLSGFICGLLNRHLPQACTYEQCSLQTLYQIGMGADYFGFEQLTEKLTTLIIKQLTPPIFNRDLELNKTTFVEELKTVPLGIHYDLQKYCEALDIYKQSLTVVPKRVYTKVSQLKTLPTQQQITIYYELREQSELKTVSLSQKVDPNLALLFTETNIFNTTSPLTFLDLLHDAQAHIFYSIQRCNLSLKFGYIFNPPFVEIKGLEALQAFEENRASVSSIEELKAALNDRSVGLISNEYKYIRAPMYYRVILSQMIKKKRFQTIETHKDYPHPDLPLETIFAHFRSARELPFAKVFTSKFIKMCECLNFALADGRLSDEITYIYALPFYHHSQ